MLKTWFSASQNVKKGFQTKHKNQVRNLRFLEFWVLEYEWWYLLLGCEYIKVIRLWEFKNDLNILVYEYRYYKFAYLMYRPQQNEVWPLFHFDIQLLTSKHPKLFCTYLVERNGDMWKTWFSASQNAKN